eukprot:jgi/Psemu1/285971/fgenesh1_pg.110_\
MAFGKIFATAFFLLSLGSCFLTVRVARAELFLAPTLKWSLQLEESGRLSGRGLRRGNAIVAHKDGTKIVATTDDGSLHIIQTTNQVKTLAVYAPDRVVGRSVSCRSGASVVDKQHRDGLYVAGGDGKARAGDGDDAQEANEDFIVYAVVDNTIAPDLGSVESVSGMTESTGRNEDNDANSGIDVDGVTSRVIAVNMDGSFRWSVQVSGRIEGSPLVGNNGIYVTHNDNGAGRVSVIRTQSNGRGFVAATVGPTATEPGSVVPLGPPALQKPAFSNQNQNQNQNRNQIQNEGGDVVIVAESWDSGFSVTTGGLYMLSTTNSASASATDAEQKDNETDYELVKISSWPRSAIAPPLVHGDSIFLGVAGGLIGGFTGDRRSDLSGITSGRESEIFPRWNHQVAPNPRNASQPLRNQPALDLEGEFLVIPGVDADFYCIQSDNGRQVWRDDQGSQVMAQPRIFEAEGWRKVVYVVETQNGRVRQYDLLTGRRFWDYSCSDISDTMCRDAVEAEFAITQNGNTIYYGDIYGRINALAVANFATESPTTAPSPVPSTKPTGVPTATLVSTDSPSSTTDSPSIGSKPTSVVAASPWEEVDTDDQDQEEDEDEEQEQEQDQQPWKDEEQDQESKDETSSIIDQQQANNGGSKKTAAFIGVAMAALCALMIPIVIIALFRRKRKKPKKGQELVVEIIDDCSSGDEESADDDEDEDEDEHHFRTSEINEDFDPYNGDGIEVEMKVRTVPTQGSPSKRKKRKKKITVPDTPNTVNTLESIEELPGEASAMVVVDKEHDIEDPSVEAVNLRQTFEKTVDTKALAPGEVLMRSGSNHLEIAVGDINDSFLSDDDIPPPPPPPLEEPGPSSSKQWTWGSLLQVGTSQSSKKGNAQSTAKESLEKLELKKASRVVSAPREESPSETSSDGNKQFVQALPLPISRSTSDKKSKSVPPLSTYDDFSETSSIDGEPIAEPSQQTTTNPDKSDAIDMETEESAESPLRTSMSEEEKKESEESEIRSPTPEPPQDESPASPQSYSMLRSVMNSFSPSGSVRSNQESSSSSSTRSRTSSVGSDDESLYTSYTGMTGGPREKKDGKDLSPLSSYVFDQDIRRRDRSEIVNEGQGFLNQPDLSNRHAGQKDKFHFLNDEEHPDDEMALAPGMQYMPSVPEETPGSKYGRSVRSKRDSNSFTSTNAVRNEYTHTPLAQMYDQLAAIGHQKREEKRPAFKRRSKRMERENPAPHPQQNEEQSGDTWGSFLNELAEAEKHFFAPSTTRTKSLLNDGDSDNSADAEVARINNLNNH